MAVMLFCYEGLVLDQKGRYFQPRTTVSIEGFVELEVPENPEIQFYDLEAGVKKIGIGPVDVISLFDMGIQVKPYRRFNEFELRVLALAIEKKLKVDFDEAKQVLSLQDLDDDVNLNIQSSLAPRMVRKKVVGGMVKVPEDAACLGDKNEFEEWSKTSKEVEGLSEVSDSGSFVKKPEKPYFDDCDWVNCNIQGGRVW